MLLFDCLTCFRCFIFDTPPPLRGRLGLVRIRMANATTTPTICSVWNALPLPSPTTTSLQWLYGDNQEYSGGNAVVTFVPPDCWNYWRCTSTQQPNPDIAGIGVTLAFLITAWTSLAFIVWAYFSGRIPQSYLNQIDTICFKAHSNRCHEDWTKTMEKVVLIFSDQQLVTGLAILLAGFSEAYSNDLDVLHWQILVYLAWTSSAVHLVTLSMLRNRLSRRPFLRKFRIVGMIILFALLATALFPQTRILYLQSLSQSVGTFANVLNDKHSWMYISRQGLPIRCFWNGELNALYDHSFYASWYSDPPLGLNLDAVISYLTLCVGYVWKLCQLVPASHQFMRKWCFAKPTLALENALKKSPPQGSHNVVARLRVFCYVLLVLAVQPIESFMATLLLLCGTLAWGTMQLVLARTHSTSQVRAAEFRLSFGQVLPLLLLLQPVITMLEYLNSKCTGFTCCTYRSFLADNVIVKKKAAATAPSYHVQDQASQPSTCQYHGDKTPMIQRQKTIDIIAGNLISTSTTLTTLIKTNPPQTLEEKITNPRSDPIVSYVCRTRLLRSMIWLIFSMVTIDALIVLALTGWFGSDNDSYDTGSIRITILAPSLPFMVGFICVVVACCLPWNKQLR